MELIPNFTGSILLSVNEAKSRNDLRYGIRIEDPNITAFNPCNCVLTIGYDHFGCDYYDTLEEAEEYRKQIIKSGADEKDITIFWATVEKEEETII